MGARYDVYARLRELNGWTDSDVANMTGISRSTFSDWKAGRSEPKQDKVRKLVRLFHVNFYEFYGEAEKPFENRNPVTDAEYQIIVALRQHPEMYDAVCKLLEIQKGKGVTADLA